MTGATEPAAPVNCHGLTQNPWVNAQLGLP